MRLFIPLIFACAACAPAPRYSWDVGGRNQQQVAQDRYECERDSMAAAPAAIIQSPSQPNSQTECIPNAYGGFTCDNKPRVYADPFGSMQRGTDANAQNRNRLFAMCMLGRGYRVVKQQ